MAERAAAPHQNGSFNLIYVRTSVFSPVTYPGNFAPDRRSRRYATANTLFPVLPRAAAKARPQGDIEMFRNVFAITLELLCWIVVAMLCIALGSLPARAAQPGPVGTWVTAGNSAVIEIYQCGDQLCGAISGIVLAPTDRTPVDWQ